MGIILTASMMFERAKLIEKWMNGPLPDMVHWDYEKTCRFKESIAYATTIAQKGKTEFVIAPAAKTRKVFEVYMRLEPYFRGI